MHAQIRILDLVPGTWCIDLAVLRHDRLSCCISQLLELTTDSSQSAAAFHLHECMAQLQANKPDAAHCVLHVVQGDDKWMRREGIG